MERTTHKQREPIASVGTLWYYINRHKQHKFTNEEFKGVGVKKFEFFVRGKVRLEIKPKIRQKASAKAGAFFIIKMEVLLMQDTTKTYTVQEIAEILKVRKGYVYDMIYTGRLRAIRLSERRFRITQVALDDFFLQEEKKTAANISSYTGLHAEV